VDAEIQLPPLHIDADDADAHLVAEAITFFGAAAD